MSSEGDRARANQQVFDGFRSADPFLLDVRPAIEVVPGMAENLVLTSGAPLPWDQLIARQREAVAGGAVHQGLAKSLEEASALLDRGEIIVGSTHEHGCAGPHAGIITASTPVFVVVDRATGERGYCSVFEGDASPRRLSLGFYDDAIEAALTFVEDVVAPVLGEAIRASGGVELKALIKGAIELGDDGHVRSTAGTLLLAEALGAAMMNLLGSDRERVEKTTAFLRTASYTFLRPWMAADKAIVSGAQAVGSSIVTVMTLSCREFAIQVAGLPGRWFRGPHPSVTAEINGHFYEAEKSPPPDWGWWFGADSMLTECLGFGGFSAAAAFNLAGTYLKGHTPKDLVDRTLAMYEITHGEHDVYRIPFLGRGVPLGIDVFKVRETATLPAIHGGISKRDGSAFAGAVVFPPMECFDLAARELESLPLAIQAPSSIPR